MKPTFLRKAKITIKYEKTQWARKLFTLSIFCRGLVGEPVVDTHCNWAANQNYHTWDDQGLCRSSEHIHLLILHSVGHWGSYKASLIVCKLVSLRRKCSTTICHDSKKSGLITNEGGSSSRVEKLALLWSRRSEPWIMDCPVRTMWRGIVFLILTRQHQRLHIQ